MLPDINSSVSKRDLQDDTHPPAFWGYGHYDLTSFVVGKINNLSWPLLSSNSAKRLRATTVGWQGRSAFWEIFFHWWKENFNTLST